MVELPEVLRERYQVVEVLGQGSSGVVLLAEDMRLDRRVAIKLLPERASEDALARFSREATALACLDHPHIVAVHCHGLDPDCPWLMMEYLDGPSLAELEAPPDPLPLMLPVAEGLDAVHAAELVHRDVKPENIVLAEGSRPVLVDFGLVRRPGHRRVTRTGEVVGTASFMAPEALMGDVATPATDWYAWGASLYRLLERRPPFDTGAIVRSLQRGFWPPLEFSRVPEGDPLRTLLARLLASEPEKRPSSAAAIRELLVRSPELVPSRPRRSERPVPTRALRLDGDPTRERSATRRVAATGSRWRAIGMLLFALAAFVVAYLAGR